MQAESTSKSDRWAIAGRKASKMRDQLERRSGSNHAELSQKQLSQRALRVIKDFSQLRQKMLMGDLNLTELREEGRRF